MEMDSAKVVVLDIRFPTMPVEELRRHKAPVNTLAWAPHRCGAFPNTAFRETDRPDYPDCLLILVTLTSTVVN